MAVEVTLTGGGSWQGGSAELADYSVEEESTPIEGSDTGGAVPGISFTVVANDETALLYDSSYALSDESNGSTLGTISAVNIANGVATISGESRLSALVAVKHLAPMTGTLREVLSYYLTECGITSGVSYDPEIEAETTPATVQGWHGSVWDAIKMLCIVHQIEVSLVSDAIVFRPLRVREVTYGTDSSVSAAIERGELATSIEVIRYENTYRANAMVYPAGGWNEDLEIYSVESGETIEVEIPVDVSLISIEQPTCVTFVAREYTGPSVYTVAGNDGLPVTPAMWANFGGKVEVSIGEDFKTIVVKITGADLPEYGPYSLSVNSGSSEAYSTLRLRGTGVHFTTEVSTFQTGTESIYASQDVGITVDNPMIQTPEQVASIGLATARKYGNPNRTLDVNATVLNRKGEPGHIVTTTFGDFDAARSDSYTFQSFKDEFAGMTFLQIRDKLRTDSDVYAKFENQAFGNISGSKVRYGDLWYRIRRATITPGGVSYSAEADTTFEQVKEAQSGRTFADLKASRTGMSFADIALVPLRV